MNFTVTEHDIIHEPFAVEEIAQTLAGRLIHYSDDPAGIILALPSGDLALPSTMSRLLNIPMEVFIARTLRAPCSCPCTIGALTENDVVYLDSSVIARQACLHRDLRTHIEREIQAKRLGIARQRRVLRAGNDLHDLYKRHVLFVDDGAAPSSVLFAVIEGFRRLEAGRIVAVIPKETAAAISEIRRRVDDLIVAAS